MMPVSARHRASADVIVCVHNSPDDVRRCLASATRTLGPSDRLIIVDDGSADETRLICEQAAQGEPDRVHLIRRPKGSGFCRAANAGLRESSAEIVVLLNSDTVVVGDWLDRIVACLSTHRQIGLAGPLSNAGGWQSIPELKGRPPSNPVRDDDATLTAIHAHCAEFGTRFDYPIVEQLNGFCLAVKRAVFDTIGLLDEELFPMGYGEEKDFALRAADAGFLCAVAIDCFVYHAKTKSYSASERDGYSRAGAEKVNRRHGARRVKNAIQSTQAHPILSAVRAQALAIFERNGWLLPD
jgi:GT2 family glycosyltransferase